MSFKNFFGHIGKFRKFGQWTQSSIESYETYFAGEETITVAPFAGSAMISPIDDEKTRDRDVVQLMLAEQGRQNFIQLLQHSILFIRIFYFISWEKI